MSISPLLSFSWTKLVGMIIFSFFFICLGHEVRRVVNEDRTCICAYDGLGYYMYLPQLLNEGNLFIEKDQIEKLASNYCEDVLIYQLHQRPNGKWVDIYHMGIAAMQAPGFISGHLIAKLTNYPQDGFSKPYHIAYLLQALLYIGLGLLFCGKLFRLFFSDQLSALLLVLIYTATNIGITFTHQFELPHLYTFFLNAAFIYYVLRYSEKKTRKHLLFSVLLFGLSTFVRPTQAVIGLLPLVVWGASYGWNKGLLKLILLFPLSALIWNLPQMLYWIVVGEGFPLLNLHLERVLLSEPNLIDFNFSFKKGWLLYSPIMILSILGMYFTFKKKRFIGIAFGLLFLIYIYVMASWECWWYAASFGQRPMVDIYPILFVLIGFVFLEVKQVRVAKVSLTIFCALAIALSVFQSIQFDKGILHISNMTKEHYTEIWGKLDPSEVDFSKLEIDREKLDWLREFDYDSTKQLYLSNIKLWSLPEPLRIKKAGFVHVIDIPVLDYTKTNEVQTQFAWEYLSEDMNKQAEIRVDFVKKGNHIFDWNTIMLNNQNKASLNIPYLDNQNDLMRIVVYNESEQEIEIKRLEINAICLRRN